MPPKAAGGYRLIILHSAAYRAWRRLQRGELRPLQQRPQRYYSGAAQGNSAIDSAWVLAADTEQNVSAQRHAATIIADYSKYYETISLDEARDKLVRLEMSMPIVKVLYTVEKPAHHQITAASWGSP